MIGLLQNPTGKVGRMTMAGCDIAHPAIDPETKTLATHGLLVSAACDGADIRAAQLSEPVHQVVHDERGDSADDDAAEAGLARVQREVRDRDDQGDTRGQLVLRLAEVDL